MRLEIFDDILWTPHTDNRVKLNKSKITPYENKLFNSVVIIFDVIMILVEPTVLRTSAVNF